MAFVSQFEIQDQTAADEHWFVFKERQLLVASTGETPGIPTQGQLGKLLPCVEEQTVLGNVEGRVCRAGDMVETRLLPDGFAFCDLRRVFPMLPEDIAHAAGYGYHLIRWKRSNRFCGRCGSSLEDSAHERSRYCPSCSEISYPRVFPAVIVAVSRHDRILLARAGRFPSTLFSVLAGYVEPGETLEACVRREVREEVGIELRNIRYFGSQSWPFSSALMVAFTAEHAKGAIRVDGREIVEADWFPPDALPPVPEPISIARRLIDDFVDRASGNQQRC